MEHAYDSGAFAEGAKDKILADRNLYYKIYDSLLKEKEKLLAQITKNQKAYKKIVQKEWDEYEKVYGEKVEDQDAAQTSFSN